MRGRGRAGTPPLAFGSVAWDGASCLERLVRDLTGGAWGCPCPPSPWRYQPGVVLACLLLQLDDVAVGVEHVDREAHAAGAVAWHRVAQHLDALLAEVAHQAVHVVRFDSEAEVVDVAAGVRGRRIGGDQVDHALACAELDQADRVEPSLFREPQHPGVEVERARLVATAHDDVIELDDAQLTLHEASKPRLPVTRNPSSNCLRARYARASTRYRHGGWR